MYIGMTHTHVLMSALFLLAVLLKTVFLLSGQDEMLEKFKRKFKIPEIVVETLMLLTGIYLAFASGWTTHGLWFWVKLIAIFIAVPFAIVAFKRMNKGLAVLSLILLLYAYGISETKSPVFNKKAALISPKTPEVTDETNMLSAGTAIYQLNCAHCHGKDGHGGKSGAPDLHKSSLNEEEVVKRIEHGKNAMPAYGRYLSEKQVEAVARYVLSLREEN